MRISHLVLSEIAHRKLGFALTLLCVTVAMACLVAAQVVLRSDEIQTARILSEKHASVEMAVAQRKQAVETAGKQLQDAIRKQMLGLGFNVLIVPESQDLSQLHLTGTLTETMPESYVDKLANSKIVTVNHLLPSVTGRLDIEHAGIQVEAILQGTRGEVPIMHRGLKKPLLDAVPPGTVVVGYQIHRKLNLKVADKINLLGKEFEVTKLHPQRGSADDVTVWIDLGQAQELLGMQNVINAILALECECAGDRISQIRAEIEAILPGTKVVERYSKALARAEARAKAKQTAEAALLAEQASGVKTLAREKQMRVDIEARHAGLVRVLVPITIVGCAIWIGALALSNVRQRSSEIGILRAIGLRAAQILTLFLARAVITGLLGGMLGCAIGLFFGARFGGLEFSMESLRQLLTSSAVVAVLGLAPVLAPLLAAIASWLPAMLGLSRIPPSYFKRNDPFRAKQNHHLYRNAPGNRTRQ